MKILLVGSDFKYGIEQHYKKYLRQFGCEIMHFPAPDIVFQQYSKNVVNKILFKSGLFTGYRKVNRELIRIAEEFNPDIIWIFKGMEIYPATLERIGKFFKLANYNPDHPFIISGPGSGNKNVTRSIGLYHLHFCYNADLQKQIREKFTSETVFLPFGFELDPEEYEEDRKLPEISQLCFIGNPDEKRKNTVMLLAKKGIPVSVYGHNWDGTGLKKFPNVRIYDAIYGREFWREIRRYRVQLNVFRKHNQGSHNMRSFEIPAAGGIQLSPYSDELASFFKEGEEIFFYRNDQELLEQAKNLLMASAAQAESYRNAARTRSVNSGYSYRDRAMTVYQNFQKLIG